MNHEDKAAQWRIAERQLSLVLIILSGIGIVASPVAMVLVPGPTGAYVVLLILQVLLNALGWSWWKALA